jgi:hypothetical protein
MRRARWVRTAGQAGLILMLGSFVPAPAAACELCYSVWWNFGRSYCKPLQNGETGTTVCEDVISNTGGSFCTEGGDYCTIVDAGGGGGGTGGGGTGSGGTTCQTTGACPAECFSCSGGNGRPAT